MGFFGFCKRTKSGRLFSVSHLRRPAIFHLSNQFLMLICGLIPIQFSVTLLQLLLENIEDFKGKSKKGKQMAGTLSDLELITVVMEDEILDTQISMND